MADIAVLETIGSAMTVINQGMVGPQGPVGAQGVPGLDGAAGLFVVRVTESTSASANSYLLADTSGTAAGSTYTLPDAPQTGWRVKVLDVGGALETKPITIAGNGHDVAGGGETRTISTPYQGETFIYDGETDSWRLEEKVVATLDTALRVVQSPKLHASDHATGGPDALAPAAIGALGLDCSAEVSVTAAGTLTPAAFGKMHVINLAADGTLVLPAVSGNAGKLIGIRIAQACAKLVTLDGNGSEAIDGALTRVMWAGESAVLLCDGAGWTKIAGKTIPMRARIYQGVAQAIPTGALTKTSLSQANYDIGYLSDVANYQVKIRRAGYYQITGTATFANAISYQHYVSIDGSNIITTATSASNGYSPPATGTLNLSAGTAIAQAVYQGTGSSQNTYVTAFPCASPCSLTVIEVATW